MKNLNQNPMKLLFLAALLLASALVTPAQANSLNPEEILQLIGVNQHIRALAETDKYVWVGTDDGLFQILKSNNKVNHLTPDNSVLPGLEITAICSKSNGEVYIGTTNGLVRFDNFTFILLNNENCALNSNHIKNLTCDNQDQVWIETDEPQMSYVVQARTLKMN